MAKKYQCPCCGGALDRALGDRGRPLFGPIQQALFNAVKQASNGIDRESLYERVYAGAEARSLNLISTMVWQINQKIRPWGLEIRGSGGPGSVYHLLRRNGVGKDREPLRDNAPFSGSYSAQPKSNGSAGIV